MRDEGCGMIDWARVADLRSEIGEENLAEVIALFLEETDEVIVRLDRHGRDALGKDMHFLKGSALNLGFSRLAALCHDGERQAVTGERIDLRAVLSCYSVSKDAFRAGLRRVSA